MNDASERRALARRLMPLLDFTSLGEDDTPALIEALCTQALAVPVAPAAVCVYPEHVTTCRRRLGEGGIRVATVVNFPDGGEDAGRASREARRAIAAGADEIDLVMPWRALRDGRADVAHEVVAATRAACGPGIALKLILETGCLETPVLIREACRIGLEAGVDFLKTSTGKVPVNATPGAVALILEALRASDRPCGLKVAGGVRTLEDGAAYLQQVETAMGAAWIAPEHLRIGASALFAPLAAALEPA